MEHFRQQSMMSDLSMAKIEYSSLISEMLPFGKLDLKKVFANPTISEHIRGAGSGKKTMLKAIYLIVLDYCNSQNVKMNMNDDQIIESAQMLLDQCGNYRIEDYACMFTLAKRGKLDVEIYQSIDITTISKIEQSYDKYSTELLNRQAIEEHEAHKRKYQYRKPETEEEIEAEARFGKLIGIMEAWKKEDETKEDESEKKSKIIESYARLQDIDIEKIRKEFKGL